MNQPRTIIAINKASTIADVEAVIARLRSDVTPKNRKRIELAASVRRVELEAIVTTPIVEPKKKARKPRAKKTTEPTTAETTPVKKPRAPRKKKVVEAVAA